MRTLLVPFDNSECAMRALDHALSVAGSAGETQLVIATAHEPPIVYGPVAVYLPEDKARAFLRQHAEDILKPAIERASKSGVPFTTEILEGDIAKTIVNLAVARGCNGIVMGTHGRGAVGKLLLGSIANTIIHLAPMPVTLVK
jgi:nucleotide-binding universal stress UspA family protein